VSSAFDRRDFLRLTAVAVAGPVVACNDDDVGYAPDREVFPQSVASGDPRPGAVVLWTRAVDPDRPGEDLAVTLEVATEERFRRVVARVPDLVAAAAHDGVVKVRVTGLAPRTRYFYRFRALRGGTLPVVSPAGRTRTAPAPEQAVNVRLAIASCQDYRGRYYNAWQQLLDRDEDLDFVLFLGDYIYETVSGRPDQGPRGVQFSDPASAMPSGGAREGGGGGLAARSLSNYRDLYKAFRSDPVLQRVHERHPFVVIWDDHEFSNDCWGANATYSSGAADELQIERRRNAERAFFEFMPLDDAIDAERPPPAGAIDPQATPVYPQSRIHRQLIFGAYLRLVLLDFRSRRADHLVAEDAYPGTPFLAGAELAAAGLAARAAGEEFALVDVDVETPARAAVKAELLAAAVEEAMRAGLSADAARARAEMVVRGRLAVAHVNAVLGGRGMMALAIAPGSESERGLAFVHMGKRAWFTPVGSRFVLVDEIFQAYASAVFARTGGDSEQALGKDQEDWLKGILFSPRPRGWTVVGSSVSMSNLVLDLAGKPGVPADLQARFLFTADQWDGFPHKRAELLRRMRESSGGRTLVVAGDIHAAYASVEDGVPCLTTPAISSSTASEVAVEAVAGYGLDPTSTAIALLIAALDGLFKQANPGMVLSDVSSHGVLVLDVGADAVTATYHLIPAREARTSYAGRAIELRALVKDQRFRVEPGRITPMP
jgi:alkaline phosphatase D